MTRKILSPQQEIQNLQITKNAQIILIGAREGRDVIKSEIGMEIEEESQSADIFDKLEIRKDQVPIRPLTEGKLE